METVGMIALWICYLEAVVLIALAIAWIARRIRRRAYLRRRAAAWDLGDDRVGILDALEDDNGVPPNLGI